MESLNGREGIQYGGLHGNPELAFLLAKLEGDAIQDLRELLQDLQGNVFVRSGGNPCLRD